MQMDVRQNLQLYKDMIQCAGPLYLWAYNDCGQLVYSNCPEEEVLAQVFELFGCKKRLYDHLLPDTPMQVASSIGLQWCAAAETDGGKVKMVYLIGPYFTENTVLRNMELAMRQLQNLNLSVETTMQIEKALKALPTLATNIMNHYAITLNYCVTGVQKNTFDIYNITDEDCISAPAATSARSFTRWSAARRWNIARSNKSFCLHYSAHCPVLNNNKIVTNVKNSSCFPNKTNF